MSEARMLGRHIATTARRIVGGLHHCVTHHWRASVVVACLVFLLEPLWRPAEEWYLGALTHAAARMPVANASRLESVAIVKIDQQRFDAAGNESNNPDHRHHYRGRSPLNRCALVKDLQYSLSVPHRIIAIDLDLSPIIDETADEKSCQSALDGLIDQNRHRLVLMAPGDGSQKSKDWQRDRASNCPLFGHVAFVESHGLTRFVGHADNLPPFGLLAGLQLDTRFMEESPEQRCCRVDMVLRKYLRDRATEAPTQLPIPFHALSRLFDAGQSLQPDLDCLTGHCGGDSSTGIRAVVFGAGYGDDDAHLTPLGRLNGVDIHALIAACKPEATGHFAHLLIDVLLAIFVFAPVLHWLWAAYFDALRGHHALAGSGWRQRLPRRPETAYLWLLLIAGVTVATVIAIFFGVTLLRFFVQWFQAGSVANGCAPLFVPAAIAVGMAIDAGVVAGIGTASHAAWHDAAHGGQLMTHQRLRRGLFAIVLLLTIAKLNHWWWFD